MVGESRRKCRLRGPTQRRQNAIEARMRKGFLTARRRREHEERRIDRPVRIQGVTCRPDQCRDERWIAMIKQVVFLRKRPDLTMEQFMDYYENQHSQLSKRIGAKPPLPNAQRYVRRYIQP